MPADARAPQPAEQPAEDSAQAAAAIVRSYYALLTAGRYAEALRCWDAPGLTLAAFRARYAPYRRYRGQVGAPGPVDAGAGQRYVEVPVHVSGRQRGDGHTFQKFGKVTLHRVADIDGATAAQRRWRIRASTAEPGAALFRSR